MTVTLTIDQQCLLELVITDRAGNPAAIDGTPSWASSDDTAASLRVSADGMTATVIAGEQITAEAVMVTATIDADIGDGVRQIIGTQQVNVTAGEAQFVELRPGAPEPKA